MKRATKKAKIIAFFQANPTAKPKDVAAKFSVAMPAVYNLRKQAMSQDGEWKVVATMSSDTPAITPPEFKPSTKANDQQYGGDHYVTMGVQPWKAMESWMSPEAFAGFLRGNAIKYLARADKKGGLEDLKKARHYLDKLVEISGGNA